MMICEGNTDPSDTTPTTTVHAHFSSLLTVLAWLVVAFVSKSACQGISDVELCLVEVEVQLAVVDISVADGHEQADESSRICCLASVGVFWAAHVA